jgi:hypothetical protein
MLTNMVLGALPGIPSVTDLVIRLPAGLQRSQRFLEGWQIGSLREGNVTNGDFPAGAVFSQRRLIARRRYAADAGRSCSIMYLCSRP